MLSIDLDGLKAVNDRLGHAAGDLTLLPPPTCPRGALRDGDLLARYSGEEFVAVLPDVPPDLVQPVAQRTADAVLRNLVPPSAGGGAQRRAGSQRRRRALPGPWQHR